MRGTVEGMYSHSKGTHLIVNLRREFTIRYLYTRVILHNLGDCEITREKNFLCIEYEGSRARIISLMEEIYGKLS